MKALWCIVVVQGFLILSLLNRPAIEIKDFEYDIRTLKSKVSTLESMADDYVEDSSIVLNKIKNVESDISDIEGDILVIKSDISLLESKNKYKNDNNLMYKMREIK